ncbi:MAG: DUF481 domain-containing protein [Pseudomonadota bacterium]
MRGTQPLFLIAALGCALILTSLSATAASSSSNTTKAAKPAKPISALPDLSWVPPDDDFDWIQLKSGEWLKGQLKAVQDHDLNFDSEEMDYQTIEWEKIRQLRTGRNVQILLLDGEVVTGRVMITPTEAWMLADPGKKWPRDQVQSITNGGSKERSYWSGDISVGLTTRFGNVEQTDYNSYAHLQRRTPNNRLLLDYIANYSAARDEVNSNDWRVSVRLDTWLTQKLALSLPALEYFSDPIQNIGDRTTAGMGQFASKSAGDTTHHALENFPWI